jgi:hypothetical protein
LRFRRDGEHVVAGVCSHPELIRRGNEAAAGIDCVAGGQLVAVPLKDSLDGQPARLQDANLSIPTPRNEIEP